MKLMGKFITHIGLLAFTIGLVNATTHENEKVSNNVQDNRFSTDINIL
jgi:hypothetical protein